MVPFPPKASIFWFEIRMIMKLSREELGPSNPFSFRDLVSLGFSSPFIGPSVAADFYFSFPGREPQKGDFLVATFLFFIHESFDS